MGDLVVVVFLGDVVVVVGYVCCCCVCTCKGDLLVLLNMLVVCIGGLPIFGEVCEVMLLC